MIVVILQLWDNDLGIAFDDNAACDTLCLYVCLFPHISTNLICMRLTFRILEQGSVGMVRTLNKLQNPPGAGDITNEPMWAF